MSKGTRSPRWVRAGLCAGAAVAVLIGGGSSYALWTETGTRAPVETVDTTAGRWTWTVNATDFRWWDTSPDLMGDEWRGGDIWKDGWRPANATANQWLGPWDTSGPKPGYPIDLKTFRIVPGDEITGRFTIGADLTELDGQNLRARVAKVEVGSGDLGTETTLPLEVVAAVEGADKVQLTVTYPSDKGNYGAESGQPQRISLGDYTVTLEQVRPASGQTADPGAA